LPQSTNEVLKDQPLSFVSVKLIFSTSFKASAFGEAAFLSLNFTECDVDPWRCEGEKCPQSPLWMLLEVCMLAIRFFFSPKGGQTNDC